MSRRTPGTYIWINGMVNQTKSKIRDYSRTYLLEEHVSGVIELICQDFGYSLRSEGSTSIDVRSRTNALRPQASDCVLLTELELKNRKVGSD